MADKVTGKPPSLQDDIGGFESHVGYHEYKLKEHPFGCSLCFTSLLAQVAQGLRLAAV